MKTNFLLPLAFLASGILLVSCASPGVRTLSHPVSDSPGSGALIDSRKLAPETKSILKEENLEGVYRRDPSEAIAILHGRMISGGSTAERLSLIELCSDTGDRLAGKNPAKAIGYHLAAAELAFRDALADVAAGAKGPAPVTLAYNHSAGRVAKILFDSGHDWGETATFEGPWKSYRFRFRSRGDSPIDPARFDRLEIADYLELKHYEMKRNRRDGIGAAMIVHREGTEERREANPFLSPIGMTIPVNALLDFSRGGDEVELRVTDLLLKEDTLVQGRRLPMSSDLTVPLAVQVDYDVDRKAGFKAMTHPEKYIEHTGLYQLEPFRPDQIPVILVHGLMSNPEVWVDALNELRSDPKLRQKYQLLVFRYSTGFPIVYNSSFLRERLREFQAHYDPAGRNPRMRQLVLVGHSMGGILSNAQVRPSGDVFADYLFDRPIEELTDLSEEQKRALQDILIFEANTKVTRVICVAAPHRGSNLATGLVGSLGHRMVRFRREMFVGRSLLDIEGVTEKGRAVLKDRPDSVRGLKPDSPVLGAILQNPVREGVAVHSIVGRHKPEQPLEESSDEVVPYTSAHLDEAVSEKVVHATHTTICENSEAIEEVRRILYLHAGETPPRS